MSLSLSVHINTSAVSCIVSKHMFYSFFSQSSHGWNIYLKDEKHSSGLNISSAKNSARRKNNQMSYMPFSERETGLFQIKLGPIRSYI